MLCQVTDDGLPSCGDRNPRSVERVPFSGGKFTNQRHPFPVSGDRVSVGIMAGLAIGRKGFRFFEVLSVRDTLGGVLQRRILVFDLYHELGNRRPAHVGFPHVEFPGAAEVRLGLRGKDYGAESQHEEEKLSERAHGSHIRSWLLGCSL